MTENFYTHLENELTSIEEQGLYKRERLITSKQSADIVVTDKGNKQDVINFCANNYLGLADHPELVGAGQAALEAFGFGMASVRFICGTQTQHRDLERALARWLGYDDAILYAACFLSLIHI